MTLRPMDALRIAFFFLFLLFFTPSATADRDIVFAARYYTPAKSRTISHFQIYRINPDGTGKTPLTQGVEDCIEPEWSPDGKHILYRSYFHNNGLTEKVWLMDANGGNKRRIEMWGWRPTEHFWVPDKAILAVTFSQKREDNKSLYTVRFYDLHTGRIRPNLGVVHVEHLIPNGDDIFSISLSPNRQLLALTLWSERRKNSSPFELLLINVATGKVRKYAATENLDWSQDGRFLLCTDGVINIGTGKKVTLTANNEKSGFCWLKGNVIAHLHQESDDSQNRRWSISTLGTDGIERTKKKVQNPFPNFDEEPQYYRATLKSLPLSPATDVTVSDSETCYRIETSTGKAFCLVDSSTAPAWSPNKEQFVSSSMRGLEWLGKHRDGRDINVYVSHLELYNTKGKKLKMLTPGFVAVNNSVGWRHPR